MGLARAAAIGSGSATGQMKNGGLMPIMILSLALATGMASGGPPTVGQSAPDFTLNDQNGHPVRLSDFRGRKSVVLAFYIRAFTPG